MTRYERFTRMLTADTPRVPWLTAFAGLLLGASQDDAASVGEWLGIFVTGMILVVCAVWLIALVIDVTKRLGLYIADRERQP